MEEDNSQLHKGPFRQPDVFVGKSHYTTVEGYSDNPHVVKSRHPDREANYTFKSSEEAKISIQHQREQISEIRERIKELGGDQETIPQLVRLTQISQIQG